MSQDTPLPLYREFRPLASSTNVSKALAVLAGPLLDPELIEWLDSERATLSGEVARRPRCIECGCCPCACPDVDDPSRADPYATGGSADCHYIGAADQQRLERQEEYERVMHELLAKAQHGPIHLLRDPPGRDASDESDRHELECERALEEQGRISAIHGKPWHQVLRGSTVPVHWLDSTHEGGPVSRPWEVAETTMVQLMQCTLTDLSSAASRASRSP